MTMTYFAIGSVELWNKEDGKQRPLLTPNTPYGSPAIGVPIWFSSTFVCPEKEAWTSFRSFELSILR